ncbi:MAG TPA: NifB/NifX family molybdenum-iron cluster-binding protein [Candidatus Methylomirabilis sp.]|nr:NifB/NifX family molybdenum-iron cluster-binding protein [Candidatus Methylomirabilis sp.]
MKIAAITDDGKSLSRHFGRAQYFLVATIEEGRVTGQELRPKAGHQTFAPHEATVHHISSPHGFDPASQRRHGQVLVTIQDCETVLAGGMGQGMYQNLHAAGIRPILTDLKDIQEALRAFVEGRLVEHPERVH